AGHLSDQLARGGRGVLGRPALLGDQPQSRRAVLVLSQRLAWLDLLDHRGRDRSRRLQLVATAPDKLVGMGARSRPPEPGPVRPRNKLRRDYHGNKPSRDYRGTNPRKDSHAQFTLRPPAARWGRGCAGVLPRVV